MVNYPVYTNNAGTATRYVSSPTTASWGEPPDPRMYMTKEEMHMENLERVVYDMEGRLENMQRLIIEISKKYDKAIEILKSQGINITELV